MSESLANEAFVELCKRVKREADEAEAVIRAALAQKVVALELYNPRNPKRRLLLTRDTMGWGYRITDVDAIGPIGHRCYEGSKKDIRDMAIEYHSAIKRGWLVKDRKGEAK